MKCTRCESDNVQRFEVIYETGTSQISTSSKTVGGGHGGQLGVGGAYTTTSGTSTTMIASKASPPEKKDLFIYIVLCLIGLLVIFNAKFFSGIFFLGLIMLAIFGLIVNANFKYNEQVFPGEYENWRHMWNCNKCGHTFRDNFE
jgi:hypothetical protein